MPMRTALLILVMAAAVATMPACNAAQLGALQAQAKLAADDAAAAKAELVKAQATAAALRESAATQPDGPAKDAAIKSADVLEAGVAKAAPVVDKIAEAARVLADKVKAADPSDQFAGAQAIVDTASIIPGWGALISAIGGLALGLIRAGYNRSAARAMAKGLELAQDPLGIINLADPKTGDKIRTVQGAGAGRIVDEAQGKVMALPF
jgi:hypothetical protein